MPCAFAIRFHIISSLPLLRRRFSTLSALFCRHCCRFAGFRRLILLMLIASRCRQLRLLFSRYHIFTLLLSPLLLRHFAAGVYAAIIDYAITLRHITPLLRYVVVYAAITPSLCYAYCYIDGFDGAAEITRTCCYEAPLLLH